jgi:hypothetical protein
LFQLFHWSSNMTLFQRTLIAAALAGVSLASQAQTNLLTNGSFDGTTGGYIYNGAAPGNPPELAGTVAGWTGNFVSIASGNGSWGNPSSIAGFDSSFGGYVAGVQGSASLSQTVTLGAGEYQLSWFDANRVGYGDQSYKVYFGTQLLGSFGTAVAGNTWKQESVSFTTSGGTGALSFVGQTDWYTNDATSFVDKASLTAVPEPTTTALMMMGTLALLARRRRIGR